MPFSPLNYPFSILATQLPALPEGPALENVRGPIKSASGYETWQIALAILLLLLVAGAFIWLYRRSIKQPAAPLDPHATALAELDAASQATDNERFAMLSAKAVRRYMETCFDLPATSQTSAEIAARLPLTQEEKDRIRNFLDDCDRVKFARQAFSQEQRIELLDTAKHLVETFERKEAKDPA